MTLETPSLAQIKAWEERMRLVAEQVRVHGTLEQLEVPFCKNNCGNKCSLRRDRSGFSVRCYRCNERLRQAERHRRKMKCAS
jgi:hypothetical protein